MVTTVNHAGPNAERILVFAPLGRDTEVLTRLLEDNGLISVACHDAERVAAGLSEGAGAVLLTEELLTPEAAAMLVRALAVEPAWSDPPFLLLAGGWGVHDNAGLVSLWTVGNLTVLDRPARAVAVVTAVKAALRARRKQYEVRDLVGREQAARAEAEVANRVKDEFLANVNHELRTPLSAVLLWTRLLRSGRVPPEETAEALQAIERSALAQSRLVEDLLDVSQMASGRLRLDLRECDAASVVRAAVDMVRPVAESKSLRLDAFLDPAAGAVRADPERLQQIVANLLGNAVKFTGPGGRVSILLDRAENQVHLKVADTGKGIRPDFLPYVFERFRQADPTTARREGGLGLGLSIVRRLVELHGGTITAESPGERLGATFTVHLPAG